MSTELSQHEVGEIRPVAPAPGRTASGLPAPPGEAESRVFVASQWQLMWCKFRKHKLAMVAGVVAILIYLVAIFAEFLAPTNPEIFSSRYTYAPPQRVHFIDNSGGGTRFGPYVNGYTVTVEPTALRRVFVTDPEQRYPLRLFARGTPYKLLGFIPMDVHLIGPTDPTAPMYLLGTDRIGHDLLSRLIFGTRVSMSVGLVGVILSLVLGVALGGASGYYGGAADTVIQRVIEFLRSIPTIPLWLGLAAAVPKGWPPLRVYFAITVILSFIGWTGLARVVRGRFLSLREDDFVLAARLDGNSEPRIIGRHMVPSFLSHIIASLTLAIPGTIIAETTLSYLGLGLRSPINSWGVLLQEATNVRAVATAPWLLTPGIAVVLAVLSLNVLGDGLRDAADPYR
jgi:peptide/nickel transport system permease protein